MAFFDKLSASAKKAASGASNLARAAADSTGDLIEIQKLKIKINDAEKEISTAKALMGELYWQQHSDRTDLSAELEEQCRLVEELEQQIKELEQQIENVKEEREAERQERAAARERSVSAETDPAAAEGAIDVTAAPAGEAAAEAAETAGEKAEAAVETVEAEVVEEVKTAADGGFCTACGAQLAPGVRFCSACGAQVNRS